VAESSRYQTSIPSLPLQVFHDEGRSLHSFMYGNSAAADDSSGGTGRPHGQQAELVSQSAWWWALRKDRQARSTHLSKNLWCCTRALRRQPQQPDSSSS